MSLALCGGMEQLNHLTYIRMCKPNSHHSGPSSSCSQRCLLLCEHVQCGEFFFTVCSTVVGSYPTQLSPPLDRKHISAEVDFDPVTKLVRVEACMANDCLPLA